MLTFEQKLDRFEEFVHQAWRRNQKTFRYTDTQLYSSANTLLRCSDGWDMSVGAEELVAGLRKRLAERKAAKREKNEAKRAKKKLAKRQKSFSFD